MDNKMFFVLFLFYLAMFSLSHSVNSLVYLALKCQADGNGFISHVAMKQRGRTRGHCEALRIAVD